jgi:hypothetical protein
MIEEEVWRRIPGWETVYEVSDLGRVRSIPRTIFRGGVAHKLQSHLLLLTGPNYQHVTLSNSGRRVTRSVHRLVLDAFVGFRPDGMEGCHRDGEPSNNRLSNLRWDTVSENHLDTVRHGNNFRSRRNVCPRGHALSEPNLVPSSIVRGKRDCLACSRTRGCITTAVDDFQRLADAKFARLMGVVA